MFSLRHKLTRRKLTSVFSSLGIFLLIALVLARLTASPAQAAWFDDSWEYRKVINIPSHTSLETNVYVTVPAFDATDTARYQSDCGNLRFTDSGGKLLQYYVVDCDATANIHVLFDTLPAGASNYYLYYGNLNAQNGFASADFATAATGLGSQTAGSEEAGPAPVSYWSFDDGSASTAQDYTAQNNDLTITNAAVKTEDLCISGKCLGFDGNADRATKSYSSDTELLPGTGSFTVSAWFKHTSTAGADILVSRADAVAGIGWKLYMDSSGFMCFGIDAVAGTFPNDDACTASSYADSQWHHVAAVKNTTANIQIYVDGRLADTQTGITSSSLDGTNSPFTVGNDFDNGTNGWDGYIDEVKYSNFAKSASQIQTDFASRGSVKGTSTSFGGTGPASASLSQGLVGYWKMDEASWTVDCSTSSVTDSSGNSNNGASCPTSTGPAGGAVGKFGNAGSFTSANGHYINAGNASSLQITSGTLSAWIKTTASGRQSVMVKDNAYNMFILNGNLDVYDDAAATDRDSGVSVIDGNWHHIVVTFQSGVANGTNLYVDGNLKLTTIYTKVNQSTGVSIGANFNPGTTTPISGQYFNGTMDDLRIYNRALSPAEVAALYSFAPGPVAHIKLDENTGSTVNDSSGNWSSVSWSGSGSSRWITGKYGSAGTFNGSDDRIIVGNISSKLNLQSTDPPDFTLEAWMNPTSGITNSAGIKLQTVGAGGNARILTSTSGCTSSPCFRFQLKAGSTTVESSQIAYGTWYHVAGVYTKSDHKIAIYLNGILQNSATAADYNLSANAMNFEIGYNQWYFKGGIDDVRVYNYARTPKQIIEDMNAGHPVGGSPVASQVAYWALDEQTGQTLNNQNSAVSLTANRGTTSGSESQDPTWLLENSCKLNGCMDFDSTDDVNTVTNASAIDFDVGLASGLTFSAWIYPDTAGEGSGGRVFSKGTNTWLRVDTLASGKLDIQASLALTTANATLNVSAPVTQSAWNHVALTYTDDSDDEISLWVNGRLVGTSTDGSGTPAVTDTANLLIGNDSAGGETFDGRIDEFKIYSSELTASEIALDANAGSSSAMGGVLGTHDSEGFGGNPPVGWWKMDENSVLSATDYSGRGNDISSLSGTAPIKTSGRYGNALDFSGSGYLYRAGASSTDFDFEGTNNFSFSVWVYPRLTGGGTYPRVFHKERYVSCADDGGYMLGIGNDGTATFNIRNNSCGDSLTTSVSADQWAHLAGVYDGTNMYFYKNGVFVSSRAQSGIGTHPSAAFELGGSSNFNGKIDDLKIYNYARTAAQIAYDYNRGAPVAWYQFDECQGATAYNAAIGGSGASAGMNGTITPGGAPNTAVGDCTTSAASMWFNGATGKYNSSLDFDGTDDYVEIADNDTLDFADGQDLTVEVWINRDSFTTSDTIIAKMNDITSSTSTGYSLYLTSGEVMTFQVSDGTDMWRMFDSSSAAQSLFASSEWHHVVAVFDEDAQASSTLYFDGKPGTMTYNFTLSNVGSIANALPLHVGGESDGGTEFDGRIDNVKIYRYALTATQIQTLYNEGSAVRFGPVTGGP